MTLSALLNGGIAFMLVLILLACAVLAICITVTLRRIVRLCGIAFAARFRSNGADYDRIH